MNEYTEQPATQAAIGKKRDPKNLLIGILVAGLILLAGFFIFDHSNSGQKIEAQQQEVAKVTTENKKS